MTKKKCTVLMLVAAMMLQFVLVPVPTMANGKVRVYQTAAGGLSKFYKKGNVLYVRKSRNAREFDIYDGKHNLITENGGRARSFRISKKCKWYMGGESENPDDFYDFTDLKKSSYKAIKKEWDKYCRESQYHGDYGILIFTKNGQAYKVVRAYS